MELLQSKRTSRAKSRAPPLKHWRYTPESHGIKSFTTTIITTRLNIELFSLCKLFYSHEMHRYLDPNGLCAVLRHVQQRHESRRKKKCGQAEAEAEVEARPLPPCRRVKPATVIRR